MKSCRLCSKPLPPDRMNCVMLGEQSPEYYYVHSTCYLATAPIQHLPIAEAKQIQILEVSEPLPPSFIATTSPEPLAKGAPTKRVPKP